MNPITPSKPRVPRRLAVVSVIAFAATIASVMPAPAHASTTITTYTLSTGAVSVPNKPYDLSLVVTKQAGSDAANVRLILVRNGLTGTSNTYQELYTYDFRIAASYFTVATKTLDKATVNATPYMGTYGALDMTFTANASSTTTHTKCTSTTTNASTSRPGALAGSTKNALKLVPDSTYFKTITRKSFGSAKLTKTVDNTGCTPPPCPPPALIGNANNTIAGTELVSASKHPSTGKVDITGLWVPNVPSQAYLQLTITRMLTVIGVPGSGLSATFGSNSSSGHLGATSAAKPFMTGTLEFTGGGKTLLGFCGKTQTATTAAPPTAWTPGSTNFTLHFDSGGDRTIATSKSNAQGTLMDVGKA